MRGTSCLMVFFLVFLVGDFVKTSVGVNVTYDNRAIIIDGKRRVLVSGSIHFPRSTPEMWPDLIQKSKEGGLDIIETYVFWNSHEPVRNQYNFEGRNDLVRFMKAIAAAGMYAHLRIGPYVCAEWNYGAFPLWLHFIPGIKFRTDNEPYKAEMQRFTTKIVQMMKDNNLYASQGGPIILSQIENEYGNVMSDYGSAAQTYVKWAAGMAMSLNTGVPWVMCQQSDTPDPLINTCNGFYCDNFTPNSPKKPKMWTENWTGWFLDFGGAVPHRPSEDVAFAVARFYQRNGTFQNYYMYHGGTNFGHTSGGPFITTSYDYDAPLDEYGLIRQPKYGHLKDLHNAIKQSEGAMVAAEATNSSLGSNLEATVYNSSSGCAAFLANVGTGADATVNFNGNSYNLPAWSVSILPDCKNAVYNTAKINSSYVRKSPDAQITPSKPLATGWSSFNEPVGISIKNTFTKPGLLEQINTTSDKSDYLWYSISTDIKGNEGFLKNGTQTVLHVESLGHVLHAYVNGKLAGSGFGNGDNPKVTADISISLNKGTNKFDLLSATVGLQNYGAFFDLTGAGITGPVKLKGSSDASNLDLSPQQWTYQVGLKGEDVGLPGGTSNLWASQSPLPTKQPLTWYKTTFDAPPGNNPAVLNMTGMGKGEAWVNGQSIGRYWPTNIAKSTKCTALCDYRGKFDGTNKCVRNCGKPSQELYHVPRSWIKPNDNTLVLFEEIGGDPTQISFATLQRP